MVVRPKALVSLASLSFTSHRQPISKYVYFWNIARIWPVLIFSVATLLFVSVVSSLDYSSFLAYLIILAPLIYLQQNLLSNKSGYVTAILKFLQWLPGIEKKPGFSHWGLQGPMKTGSLLALWACLSLTSPPTTLPSLLSYQQAKHTLALGLLCLSVSLLQILIWLFLTFFNFHNATSLKRFSLTLLFKIIPQITPFQPSMLHPSYLPPIFSIALNHHLTFICSFQFFLLQCKLCHFLGEASYWWSNLKRSLC